MANWQLWLSLPFAILFLLTLMVLAAFCLLLGQSSLLPPKPDWDFKAAFKEYRQTRQALVANSEADITDPTALNETAVTTSARDKPIVLVVMARPSDRALLIEEGYSLALQLNNRNGEAIATIDTTEESARSVAS